ncbi:alpha-(1,3)-fucosyltransferase 10-like isoform X2 [Haliotis rufescens]|uniref:alpha-(1,3)-fucosyltransferase 10-like isoform X2 n=1 Tax=Haliotis rufescens TaxID=6454 RepID=UPI00201F6C5E|nr:alpha-(1,3)-fucosyltransferase 10-like isoform X2 [Haliotis rufescens]
MAGCQRMAYRCMARYSRFFKSRLFLCLVGLAIMCVTVWSFREDNRTFHSALLSLKQHGERQSGLLKYKFLSWKQDSSWRLPRKHKRPDQDHMDEALQPVLPQMNNFEQQGQNFNPGQPQAIADQGQRNWAPEPALPQMSQLELKTGPKQDQINGAPQPALAQEQNVNPGQAQAGHDLGQLNAAPQPALLQNVNPGQPNAVPDIGQLNAAPQPALPQMNQVEQHGQNLNPVQPKAVPGLGQVNEEKQPVLPQVIMNQIIPRLEESNPGLRQGESQPAQPLVKQGVPSFVDEVPVILSWHPLGGVQDVSIICGLRKCLMVKDHEEWKKHDYMGILFYGTDFGSEGLPVPRKPGHLWSVLHEESPKNNDWLFSAKSAMSIFNLTATFKRQSHYSFPTMWLPDERALTDTQYMVSIAEKNRLRREGLAPVVFVHMDCHTASDRSHYMRLLNQFIKIDSYSDCEHNKDFPSNNLTFKTLKGMGPMMSDGFFKLIAQYKFAFAFENAVCDDYITEKFWRPLRLGVVPIAFGSSKIKDMAPTDHAIIDIRDYQSVREVADLITSLDSNDVEYMKFLDFKQTGVTNPVLKEELRKRDWGNGKPIRSYFHGFQCFLCNKLHDMKIQVQTGQPVTRWSGQFDHYGCPAPKLFDDQGRYVLENNGWLEPYTYANFYERALRYHMDNNINADVRQIHRYAAKLMSQAGSGGIRAAS